MTTNVQPDGHQLTPGGAFNDLVTTMRRLGELLPVAMEARYEPPVGGAARSGGLISNPTLDTVADPRRWALSSQVTRATYALRLAHLNLDRIAADLDTALSAWEGEKTP